MNWKKALLFGLAFWGLMLVIVTVMIGVGLYKQGGEESVLTSVIAGVLGYLLAGYAKLKDRAEALKHALVWAAVGVALDALVTTKFAPNILQMWTLWFGYALMVVGVVLRTKKS